MASIRAGCSEKQISALSSLPSIHALVTAAGSYMAHCTHALHCCLLDAFCPTIDSVCYILLLAHCWSSVYTGALALLAIPHCTPISPAATERRSPAASCSMHAFVVNERRARSAAALGLLVSHSESEPHCSSAAQVPMMLLPRRYCVTESAQPSTALAGWRSGIIQATINWRPSCIGGPHVVLQQCCTFSSARPSTDQDREVLYVALKNNRRSDSV